MFTLAEEAQHRARQERKLLLARLSHLSWKRRHEHGGYWREVWYRRNGKGQHWIHRLRWTPLAPIRNKRKQA